MPRYRFTGETPEVLIRESLLLRPGDVFTYPKAIDHPRLKRVAEPPKATKHHTKPEPLPTAEALPTEEPSE